MSKRDELEFRDLIAAIPRFLLLLLRLVRDRRVAFADKAILFAAVTYAISPLDLIPDFIPLLGRLDDLYLIGLAIDRLIGNAGFELISEHWSGPRHTLEALGARLDSLARYLPRPVQRSIAARVRES